MCECDTLHLVKTLEIWEQVIILKLYILGVFPLYSLSPTKNRGGGSGGEREVSELTLDTKDLIRKRKTHPELSFPLRNV